MDTETVDLAAMERSNKVSWARFSAECDRLQSLLAAQNLSIDDLGALLSKLDPTATSQVAQITRSLRETLSMREKGREYFQASSADSAPLMPSRLRRLNRV
jgi:hypothetical protein